MILYWNVIKTSEQQLEIVTVWKSSTLCRRHAYGLETPAVHKAASRAWLEAG
jgi:hypothetical protein